MRRENVQKSSAYSPKNVIIRASAGSGKTYQLTNRLLQLLFCHKPVESILATTFSRKAAGEILDRLLARLAEAAQDSQNCEALAKTLGLKINRNACIAVLRQLIRDFHLLQIRTLDSFFVRAAQALSFELGLWPDWQIDEGEETDRLITVSLGKILEQRDRVREWMQLLFKGQAVRTITEQLRDLIVQYYENVFLEAESPAWNAIKKQPVLSETKLTEALEQLKGFFNDQLTPNFVDTLNADIKRAQVEDWEEFLKSGIAAKVAAGESTFKRSPIPPPLRDAYLPLVKHAKAVIVNRLVDQTAATYKLLAEFDKFYGEALRKEGLLRFSDVVRLLRTHLLTNGSQGIHLWQRRLGWQIQHLLLDEFQDTSSVQWAVLAPFAEQICRSEQGTFFCVGDLKQSIYAWRGSEPEIFEHIDKILPQVAVDHLDVSWRSSPVIIDVVNKVFSSLCSNPVVNREDNLPFWSKAAQQWTSRFAKHESKRAEYPGYCCVVVYESPSTAGEEAENASDLGLAPILVKLIWEVYNAPSKPSIGVLVRKNAAIQEIVPPLRAAGFEVSQEGRNPVTSALSVQLLLNVLRIADHPGDTAAAFRLGHSPLATALNWEDFPRWDPETRRTKVLKTSVKLRERLLDEGYGPVVRQFADVLSSYTPREEHLWLEKLVELAYSYDSQRTLRADDFRRWLEYQQVADPQLTRIRVMTIHGAKGLQFDAVFLPDLDESMGRRSGQLVFTRPAPGKPIDWVFRGLNQELIKANVFEPKIVDRYYAFQQRCIEEDFSLLYVAMTRAKHGLYIFVPSIKQKRSAPPKTMAGLVWNALSQDPPLTPGKVLFETGDRKWWDKLPTRLSPAAPVPSQTRPTVQLRSGAPGPRSRHTPWIIPHELESADVSPDELFRFIPVESLTRGSVWHEWFSLIGWLDRDGVPELEMLKNALTRFPGVAEECQELYQTFLGMLDKPPIKRLLNLYEYQRVQPGENPLPTQITAGLANPRWELFVERPFVVHTQEGLCRGQFDRVVVLFDGPRPVAADVIDFKTDEITESALAQRVAFYRPQLKIYREAASEWLHVPLEQVSARLVFTQLGRVTRVW